MIIAAQVCKLLLKKGNVRHKDDLFQIFYLTYDLFFFRICKECGLYRASVKSAAAHVKTLHKKEKAAKKTQELKKRPTRIAAQRAKEFLCIMREENSDTEDAVWLKKEEVDPNCIPEFHNEDADEGFPLIKNIKDWYTSPWMAIPKD